MVGAGAFLRWASFGSGIRKKRHPFNGAFSRRGQTAACRYNDPGNGRPAHQLWYTRERLKVQAWYAKKGSGLIHQSRYTPEDQRYTRRGWRLSLGTAWIQRLMSDTPIYLQLAQLWDNCTCLWLYSRFSPHVTLWKPSQYGQLVFWFICIFSIFSFLYFWWLEQCEVGCECIAGWGPSSQVRPFHASGGAEWMVCAKIVTSIAQHKWGLVCQRCQTCPPRVCSAPLHHQLSPANNNSRCMHCAEKKTLWCTKNSSKLYEIPHPAQIWPANNNLCCRLYIAACFILVNKDVWECG